MAPAQRIAIVGASLAGVRVMRALRRKGFDGEFALIGGESELPYDRPPLSKQFLTAPDAILPKLLEPEPFYESVELRLGVRAAGLSVRERAVILDGGATVTADHIIVATGCEARSLPGLPDGERLARLRTIGDARRVRAAFAEIDHLLVIGGGFIGCEVAASARQRGLQVTIVESASAPVIRGVGSLVGETIAAIHRENGVDVRLGVGVESTTELGDCCLVTLTDGFTLETDFIVVGVGASPTVDWLSGCGFDLTDGVRCDDRGRVVGGSGRIWALGDVAAWSNERLAMTLRVEHWTNASEQAAILATNLLETDGAIGHDPLPYVWSDQYEHKIQILGRISGEDDTTMLAGSLEDRRFALAYSRGGLLRGLVAFNMPREIARMRPAVAAATPVSELEPVTQ